MLPLPSSLKMAMPLYEVTNFCFQISALNGELRKTGGTFQMTDKILLAPNNPWLKSGTIRDNITFGANQLSRPTCNRTRLYEKVKHLNHDL